MSDRPQEKRSFSRIAFDSDVTLNDASGEWTSTLIDISLKGILMNTPQGWKGKRGDKGRLSVQLQGSEIEINMDAVVAHVENNTVGFRCEKIDAGSAVHLRRLVELNLGDEELLNRELTALGKSGT